MASPKSQKPHGDFTGKKTEQLQREKAAELAEREKEIAMVTQREQEMKDDTIVDLSDPMNPKRIPTEQYTGFRGGVVEDNGNTDEEDVEIVGGAPMRVVRINCDLKTNVGYANKYEFEAGQQYALPEHVIQHLDEKGVVWH